ncbi:MAG: hypothetical protein J5726_09075 [Treponema sp.]|nr:hypothetical protein [Treponema sp.]
MKKIFLVMTVILSAVLFLGCGNKAMLDDYGCFVNYEDALKNAQSKKLPLLVLFTSQGDDEQSTQLVSDVIKAPEFATDILKKYSVLHVDFSENAYQKTTAPDNADAKQQELANTYTAIMQNNYQLVMLFNVEAMPAAYLCTKEGYVVTPVDMTEDISSVAGLTAALNALRPEFEIFEEMVKETSKGSATSKVEAIDGLYRITKAEYRTFLLPLVQKVPQLDKKNETGLVGKYIVATAEAKALSAYSQGDVETAIAQYLLAADNEFVKAEDKQECFYTAAYLSAYSGSEDYNGILTYLQTAYDLAPSSDKADAIKEAVDYFTLIVDNSDQYLMDTEVDAK